MASGELTGRMGLELSKKLNHHSLDVLYDHGKSDDKDQNIGRIASWFGENYSSKSRLALIDIAIVEMTSNRVRTLIEIEETSSTPKVILGDVFGALLGDHISFQGKRDLAVRDFTTLFIYVAGTKDRVEAKIHHLGEHINTLKAHMNSKNASIGRVIISTFSDEDDLRSQLDEYIESGRLIS